MAHLNENFFRKPVNKPCFFHSCLSTSQVRYCSITIKECWNLIGWEWFMAITWEPDFSQVCSFCRMLMNHRNFHFTQIPDKPNAVIFLKSPETMFLGHFWPFLVIFAWWWYFPKNLALSTQNYIWAPKTILSFRKNKCTNFEKTYGQTLFYYKAGGPINFAII